MKETPTNDKAAILPDVLADGLDVVFCGSAAGSASARAGAYYAGPGNRFWPILHECGLTPSRLAPHEFRTVLQYGIGLTDLSKYQSGADSALDAGGDDSAALAAKVSVRAPRILAFNGKRAAAVFLRQTLECEIEDYGLQQQTLGGVAIFVLPSTSGAARRWWDAAPWRSLGDYVRRAALT
ncbi:MAG: mismatch-specific DNA-glycosylase [Alphaproteobacteria bacterium]|jgi:TDG/mug DNA glycosylase family protein|nr:mismatch-specific DNA-glycosylase [Alphaproteobacteria bacterium]MDP6588013.1 mismatch-specific DNA-glycosylase [Alphaproteobacteria bacterium]MDP6818153.1 mismatch-specific DNA-glycosylase [Alphaproteobacteria bacterium]